MIATLVRSLFLCCCVLLSLCPDSARAEREVHVIAVGNNRGFESELTLRYAERDAERFARVMQRLGGAAGDASVTLLGASPKQILAQLGRIPTRFSGNADDVTVVVYYSGHADARGLHLGDDALTYDALQQALNKTGAGLRIMILDSCRSGGATRGKGVKAAETFDVKVDAGAKARGLAIMTSSTESEASQESDRLRGSFFTHHLVTGLRGAADRDGNGRVSLDEAYRYTYDQTLRSSGRTRTLQHPSFEVGIRGRGEVVMTSLMGVRKSSATLKFPRSGHYLVFEGDAGGALTTELGVGDDGSTLLVEPGQYLVQRRGRKSYDDYFVTLQPGQVLALPDTPDRTTSYARLLRKGGGERDAIHALSLGGGARGQILDGQGVSGNGLLDYQVDFESLSVGVRFRFGLASPDTADPAIAWTHTEYGLGLLAKRYFDLTWGSVWLGLQVEGALHSQTFTTRGVAEDRLGWSVSFGALLGLDVDLTQRLILRFEAGPLASIVPTARLDSGVAVGDELASSVTWWAGAGLGWRF